FFSSRRRHTRWPRDWSSDVCSSDLDRSYRSFELPFRFLVQHIGVGGESFDERKLEAAITSIEHLRAFAKTLGVRILLENIPNELATPDRLMEFIHLTLFDDVGVCFDVGHAHIMSNVA